jgi:hypothetical protein
MYEPRLPQYFEELEAIALDRSHPQQLQAIRELLDRLIGKPQVYIDTTTQTLNLSQLYVEALRKANEPKVLDGEPTEPQAH